MRRIVDQVLNLIPLAVVVVVVVILLNFVLRQGLSFQELEALLRVLIWPTVVFLAFLFFRKVFTYLFFSMESFGFFGVRGKLKDVREIIAEQVEKRLQQEKEQEEQTRKFGALQSQLESAAAQLDVVAQSKEEVKKEAADNLELARTIFETYRKITAEKNEVAKELEMLQREKSDRIARFAAMRERVRRRREAEAIRVHDEHEPSPEEIDAAGDAYIQRQIDIERGK